MQGEGEVLESFVPGLLLRELPMRRCSGAAWSVFRPNRPGTRTIWRTEIGFHPPPVHHPFVDSGP